MKKEIGKYIIRELLGQGGMGEVFLAYDPSCQREVALKVMREEWAAKPSLRERFFREARITARLTHPAIIPIHSIDEEHTFYTMPRIEGETLKAILRQARERAKRGDPLHPIGDSIPALIRIFLSVCSAIAYTHSEGILHRDLKPENIIIGKFAQVVILDWGLADFAKEKRDEMGVDAETHPELTRPGGIPGTLMYMAPERAMGEPATVQTDIYALGVMLFQLLTLHFPFQRNSLKEYRSQIDTEEIAEAEELAPERDIAPQLSHMVKKCLAQNPKERYPSLNDLVTDLERYIEGLPEWSVAAQLFMDRKEDWGFQENIALAKHMAITRQTDVVEWVNLLLSKDPFPGNLKLETDVILGSESSGVGIVLCASHAPSPRGLEEGYCLWLGTKESGSQLFRAGVEVAAHPELFLTKGVRTHLRLEKFENHLRLYLNGVLKLSFLNHLPMPEAHCGLMLRDGDVRIDDGLHLFSGSQNAMVNCLAVPDAFLSRKNYQEALAEYRKIARSFPGRLEGREAIFRAGVALLQQAKEEDNEAFYTAALDEFDMLRGTPGAPLEYLGKSLVYMAQGDLEEEVKCLELALRKYPRHPLKHILEENIISRLHNSAQSDRLAAYHFALMTLRHLPHIFRSPDEKLLLESLQNHLEPLPFFAPSEQTHIHMTIQLAFWLDKPMVLVEMLEKGLPPPNRTNALSALMQLGHEKLAEPFDPHELRPETMGGIFFSFEISLKSEHDPLPFLDKLILENYSESDTYQICALKIWGDLLFDRFDSAEMRLASLPDSLLKDPHHPLFFLYGCFLRHKEGEEAALNHLSIASGNPFPPTTALLSHFLQGQIDFEGKWGHSALKWEKLQLLRQLQLYLYCSGDDADKKEVEYKLQQQLKKP
ncbi:MAG: Serine/threonine-protein kinase PknD [Chlamydiae bacterium]|nr:Serine/threonine-protein kinase PknD [Chlamydiota bacterium]